MKHRSALASSLFAFAILAGMLPALAQQTQPGPGMMGQGMGPGMMGQGMMGPGMMGQGMGMMGGCPMMGMMGMDGQAGSFADGRIAFLKAELAITDAQKGVWETYAEATKRNLESMQSMRQKMMGHMMGAAGGKTPVERLDAHIAAMESRITALNDVKPALAKLYDALSPEQKTKANTLLTGMGCMM